MGNVAPLLDPAGTRTDKDTESGIFTGFELVSHSTLLRAFGRLSRMWRVALGPEDVAGGDWEGPRIRCGVSLPFVLYSCSSSRGREKETLDILQCRKATKEHTAHRVQPVSLQRPHVPPLPQEPSLLLLAARPMPPLQQLLQRP